MGTGCAQLLSLNMRDYNLPEYVVEAGGLADYGHLAHRVTHNILRKCSFACRNLDHKNYLSSHHILKRINNVPDKKYC